MKQSLIVLALAAFVVPASAGIWTFNNVLSWSQEVPPATGSLATEVATGSYDDITNNLTITSLSVNNLIGTLTASHIHAGAAGINGPIMLSLPSFGSWSGTGPNITYTQTSPIVLTPAQEALFLAGTTYFNIHTTRFPGGEARGQITPVPEPATMIALGAGVVALAARRRRK